MIQTALRFPQIQQRQKIENGEENCNTNFIASIILIYSVK